MAAKARKVIFHPPVTLADDAPKYCERVTALVSEKNKALKKSDKRFAIPGNTADDLAAVQKAAEALAPKAARIKALEAQLAAARADYDTSSGPLWNIFTEARDHARQYADDHGHADLATITDDFIYHAGHATKVAPPDPTST